MDHSQDSSRMDGMEGATHAGLTRRRLLAAGAGTVAATGLSGLLNAPSAAAAPRGNRRPQRDDRSNWRVALNTIQWIATDDGWIDPSLRPPYEQLVPFIAGLGFDGVHPDLPAGMTVRQWQALLSRYGLESSYGYLSFRLPEEGQSIELSLERAREAAVQHAQLGLSHIFLAMSMIRTAPRVLHPGRGEAFQQERLDRITDLIERAAQIMVAEGVKPLLHPHAGTWVETEYETRYVLDNVSKRLLGFGPDVGHMAFAGMNPVAVIRRYRDRVGGVHIKDMRADVAAAGRTGADTYLQTVAKGLWVEPGRGDLDLEGVFRVLGPRFDGWLIVENDRPDLPPYESAFYSAAWMDATLPGRLASRC